MKRIQVAHIINSMEVGGAQQQLANLIRAIDRERFDIRIICLDQKGSVGETLEAEGFQVEALIKRGRIDPGMLLRLRRLLKQWKPDVVHCSIFTANLWGRLVAISAHVPVIIAHEQSTVSLEKWYRRLIDRILSWRTHRILAVSQDLKRRIIKEEKISPHRVEVYYNAIDCEAIEAAGKKAEEEITLPGRDGLRVGIVGRLEYRKDHLTLVRAAQRVAREIPDIQFLLAGEGPDRPKIEAEIARLGIQKNFALLGERNDIAALLRVFDLYVLSSITEGLSLSILEAMVAQCPVVATDVGGNRELLDAGRLGKLVPPQDPESLANAILQTLHDPQKAQETARHAHARTQKLFDIHPIARQIEEIYEKAVKRG